MHVREIVRLEEGTSAHWQQSPSTQSIVAVKTSSQSATSVAKLVTSASNVREKNEEENQSDRRDPKGRDPFSKSRLLF